MEKADIIQGKAPPQGKITFDEFLEWADEDTHAEWEDGQVIMASPASLEHQDLSSWLTTILETAELTFVTSSRFINKSVHPRVHLRSPLPLEWTI